MGRCENVQEQLSEIESRAGAWLPFRSTDTNENWVAVWGQEYHTDKNGGKGFC